VNISHDIRERNKVTHSFAEVKKCPWECAVTHTRFK
jgi:hypothetical protein